MPRKVGAITSIAPKYGHAGWIGERAQGSRDVGASVIAVAFQALVI